MFKALSTFKIHVTNVGELNRKFVDRHTFGKNKNPIPL